MLQFRLRITRGRIRGSTKACNRKPHTWFRKNVFGASSSAATNKLERSKPDGACHGAHTTQLHLWASQQLPLTPEDSIYVL